MLPATVLGLANTSQVLVLDNAISEFYYAKFYRTMLPASFLIGV